MDIKDYGLSRERGFLSHYQVDTIELPGEFTLIKQAAAQLSALITSGRIRHWLGNLPDPELADWAVEAPEEHVRTAMVHYSFLVQAYVWGEEAPPVHLPANLAARSWPWLIGLGKHLCYPTLPMSSTTGAVSTSLALSRSITSPCSRIFWAAWMKTGSC